MTSPAFGNGCQNTPWFILMLPYIEQAPLYNAYNAAIGMEGPNVGAGGMPYGFVVNTTVALTRIPSFQCPSDSTQIFSMAAAAANSAPLPPLPYQFTKGNYAVNWGNTNYGQGVFNTTIPRSYYLQSPFGVTASGNGPIVIRMSSFTDGTSNTHVAAEVLQGAQDDIRGLMWVMNPGGSTYFTRFAPNGYQDYMPLYQPWASLSASALQYNNADNLASWGSSGVGTSPPSPGSLCDSQGAQGLRCNNQGNEATEFNGARSRHQGGVNAVFGDGSVHFIKNTISPITWVQLGSIAGGEVVSSDQY